MKTIKKEWIVALALLLLIPVVLVLGGALFSFINPEIAAHTSNYVLYWRLLNGLKMGTMWGTFGVALVLWVLMCRQVVRAKNRSDSWVLLAMLGPIGLAILATLKDRAASETDPYSRFVQKLNWFLRANYEVGTFWVFWELAYEIMLLKSTLMMRVEAARRGMSVAQVIDLHNASGGMWAFSEGLETMFFVVVLYLLRPMIFNLVARVVTTTASPKAS